VTTTPPQIDARQLTAAEYKASKRQIVEAGYKVAKSAPTPVFDKARLLSEIEQFEREGKTSAFSSTSSTSAPPPAKVTANSRSANDLSASEYQQAKRDIATGKVPSLAASKQNFA